MAFDQGKSTSHLVVQYNEMMNGEKDSSFAAQPAFDSKLQEYNDIENGQSAGSKVRLAVKYWIIITVAAFVAGVLLGATGQHFYRRSGTEENFDNYLKPGNGNPGYVSGGFPAQEFGDFNPGQSESRGSFPEGCGQNSTSSIFSNSNDDSDTETIYIGKH